jgi:hypothetical protein
MIKSSTFKSFTLSKFFKSFRTFTPIIILDIILEFTLFERKCIAAQRGITDSDFFATVSYAEFLDFDVEFVKPSNQQPLLGLFCVSHV